MIKKITFFIIGCSTLIFVLGSCSDLKNEYYDYSLTENSFDGSILDFLESNPSEYDSILKVINLVPGFKDSIETDDLTFFAVDNESFVFVMNELNIIRANNEKEKIQSIQELNVFELDTLVSRYLFNGVYDSELVNKNTNGLLLKSFKYDYPMHIEYTQDDASGFINSGVQRLVFSNTKESQLKSNWINTYTSTINIKVTNGVVHKLVPNHDFGFNEFVFRLNK